MFRGNRKSRNAKDLFDEIENSKIETDLFSSILGKFYSVRLLLQNIHLLYIIMTYRYHTISMTIKAKNRARFEQFKSTNSPIFSI